MTDTAIPSQDDSELRELWARAYGPHPDIQDDPRALARLAELESARLGAHAAGGPDDADPQGASGSTAPPMRDPAADEPTQRVPETIEAIESSMPPAAVAAGGLQPRSPGGRPWRCSPTAAG